MGMLTCYQVHYGDGASTVTQMAAKVTLADAQAYFVGVKFTYAECEITGKESSHICTHVTECQP